MVKKSLSLIFASLVVICGLSFVASAQTRKPFHNINQRQRNQQERISKGIQSGELTPRETARVERQEVRTNRMEQRFRESGGGLNYRERLRLENRLNRDSYNIYRQKHDKQDMPRP